jgi:hypothetical protein
MDQRLLDETVRFMNGLNLHNRYDHLVLAGAAMGARLLKSPVSSTKLPWKQVFFDHLTAAIELLKREIKDIFLLEHLDCGAYKELHPDKDVCKAYKAATSMSQLEDFHLVEVSQFAEEVREFCDNRQKKFKPKGDAANPWEGIRVRCFLMDLLGNVKEL